MNGAPLPHGGARGAAASPTSPRGGRQRGPGGKWSASPNLPAASHSPKQRSPPTRRHFGERPPRGIVQPAGSAPHPSPSPGDTWGPAPPELRLRAERAGAPSRRPGPPPPEKLAPPRPAPAGRAPRTHLAAGRATCGAPLRRASLRPAVAEPGRAAAEEGPAPRSSLAPPPGRPRPAESREARALESFGAEWRPRALRRRGGAGALAALGSRARRVGGPRRERRRRQRAGRREGPARAVTSGGSGRRQSADPGREDCQGGRLRGPGPPLPQTPTPGEGHPRPLRPLPCALGDRVPNRTLPHWG